MFIDNHEPLRIPSPAPAAADRIGDLLDRYPDLQSLFIAYGFTPLAGTNLRQTIDRWVTVLDACRYMDVDLEAFVAALTAAMPNTYTLSHGSTGSREARPSRRGPTVAVAA